jgi:hypothetical protein
MNWIIATFTSFQNAWDRPFTSEKEATLEIQEFCQRLHIQQAPWIWDRPAHQYILVSMISFLEDILKSSMLHPLALPTWWHQPVAPLLVT